MKKKKIADNVSDVVLHRGQGVREENERTNERKQGTLSIGRRMKRSVSFPFLLLRLLPFSWFTNRFKELMLISKIHETVSREVDEEEVEERRRRRGSKRTSDSSHGVCTK